MVCLTEWWFDITLYRLRSRVRPACGQGVPHAGCILPYYTFYLAKYEVIKGKKLENGRECRDSASCVFAVAGP